MSDTADALSKSGIVAGLKRLGLKRGDRVIVHSSLSSLGPVGGGADTVIDALLEAVGQEGTILVPTFGCSDEVFDPAKSETGLGAIPRAFWRRPGALRSRHPLASVAGVGSDAAPLLLDHEKAATAHGEGTPYHRLYERGGKVLLLGVDQDRSTFLHTAEEMAELDYLRPSTARYLDDRGAVVRATWAWFPGPHRNFIGLQRRLEEAGVVEKTRIGSCVAQIMECRPLLDALLGWLRAEPNLFLSSNPLLPDGVRQRADLLRRELQRESFTAAIDTRFGGRSLEEVIDNAGRFGVDRVVLSYVGHTPWQAVSEARRLWYLAGLREAGIGVAAIAAAGGEAGEIQDLLKEAGAPALIVPSTTPAADLRRHAASGEVLVANVRITGSASVKLLEALRDGGIPARLALDPLELARVCENPFLGPFTRTPIRRWTGALYVADGLATGERTHLGGGLAEIRELLSILRCRSFDGLVILQGAGPDRFVECAESFFGILRELGRCPE